MSDRVSSATPAPEPADGGITDRGNSEAGNITDSKLEVPVSQTRSLAARVARRTTDLLAIAIVAAGLLTVSGRLRDWWQNDADSSGSAWQTAAETAGTPLRWGDSQSPLRINAGDLPVVLERQRFDGSAEDVESLLQNRCEAVLASHASLNLSEVVDRDDRSAPASSNDSASPTASAVQRMAATQHRFLELIRDVTPIRQSDAWSIYRVAQDDSHLPGCTFVGVRTTSARESESSASDIGSGRLPETQPHQTDQREVVCWGMSLPESSDRHWTVWFFAPRNSESAESVAIQRSASPVPQLSNARTVLSLQTAAGEELVTLRGNVDASAGRWMQEIDEHLSRIGWRRVRRWHQSGQRWSGRFEEPLPAHVESDIADNDESGPQGATRAVEFLLIENSELRLTASVISLQSMQHVGAPSSGDPRRIQR